MSIRKLMLDVGVPQNYLGHDEIIDVDDPAVRSLAQQLRQASDNKTAFAKAAFEWVRDNVGHSNDVQDPRVTLTATEVLDARVGLCYAKAHLLTALLRSEGIPTGLCYQRLVDRDGFVLHGLVAIYLEGSWHRQDPRGNKVGVDAEFSLGTERLAWPVDPTVGEIDYPQVFASPVACVVDTLRGATNVLDLLDGGLPTALDA
jgi:transglutaminase-like putative cysteine protease